MNVVLFGLKIQINNNAKIQINDLPAARGAIVRTRPYLKHALKNIRWKNLSLNLESTGVSKSTNLSG
jgi:hypothetical protein